VPQKAGKIKDSSKPEINFNPDLFNNVFWHLKEAFDNPAIRYIWMYGGSSASKTFSAVQLQVIKMLEGPNENALVLRKYGSDILDSIYSDFKNIIIEWGLQDLFVIQQNFIKCKTGSYVRFRGLDDSEKVKGISNFKRVILEEISQFDEVDFKQVRKRLRGKKGQQIIGIFNPITEEHWIKVNVFDKELLTEIPTDISGKWTNDKGNMVILKVTYLDNKFIVGPHFVDQHVIDDFEKDKLEDFAYYSVYGLGNWGKLRTGGEFWKDFNPNLHIKPNPIINGACKLFKPDLPIHLFWDENVNPYLTCEVWQVELIKNEKNETVQKIARQIDEIFLEDPRNRVKHVCAEFRKRYPQHVVKGLFLYGDRTSWKEDTKKEKGENFFTDIINQLQDYKPQLKLQSHNPSVVQSGQFINECYARNLGKIYIEIGDNCKKSIYDYQYALEDSDGTLKKSKKKHPVTEVTYEEFGHASDAKRYGLTMIFPSEFQDYIKGGRGHRITVGRNVSKNNY
jgi:phage terminase large subunit